ncbi:hypothetical protein [Lacticaseibacillus porcinae]|uniref:hypothetical protein n=1 Tax=Lacticaseibacillus porcinae TaxID=1123687 RepID=UPI000F76A4EA|nr:hypothetical protein [Lacticaseibacillus porcinae]
MQEPFKLDTPEKMVAHILQMKATGQLTEENRLATINRMRAQSGDRPLTMAEHLAIEADSNKGIHFYTRTKPQSFFRRLQTALKRSRDVFVSAMRKS